MSHLVNIEPRRSLKNLSLKLWIVDYFDDLTNNIDIYAETLLGGKPSLSNEQINDVILAREKFVQVIQNLQLKNLNLFEENLAKIDKRLHSDFLNESDSVFRNQAQIENVKKIILQFYCCLLSDATTRSCFKLKLVSLDWYMNEYEKNILRFAILVDIVIKQKRKMLFLKIHSFFPWFIL